MHYYRGRADTNAIKSQLQEEICDIIYWIRRKTIVTNSNGTITTQCSDLCVKNITTSIYEALIKD